MPMAAICAAGLCIQMWIAWAVPETMMLAAIPTFGAMIACEALIQRARPAPEPGAKYTAEDTLFSIIAGTAQILVGASGYMGSALVKPWRRCVWPRRLPIICRIMNF